MRPAGGLSLLIGLLTGCAQAPEFHAAGPEWIDPATGRFVAIRLGVDGGDLQSVAVEADWAALIVWQERERYFCLFDNPSRAYLATRSWPQFLVALNRVPEGTRLQKFYKCLVPWDCGMPDEAHQDLDRVMQARRLEWRPLRDEELDVWIVCTCEFQKQGSIRFPAP